jgi:hypothetical protein
MKTDYPKNARHLGSNAFQISIALLEVIGKPKKEKKSSNRQKI